MKRICLAALWVGANLVSLNAMAAGQTETSPTPTTPTQIVYNFTLAPGASKTFNLPVAGSPVRLTAMLATTNGSVQTPSAVISAVIAEDTKSQQVTWIGTNGDGTQAAGNTLQGSTVASFAYSNAVLTATPAGAHAHLTITQSATGTGSSCTYRVVMEY